MQDLLQPELALSREEPSSHNAFDAAREALDHALLRLRDIAEPAVSVHDAEKHIAEGLKHVYLALAARGDFAAMNEHTRAAIERVRQSLETLQPVQSDDAALEDSLRSVAQALSHLQNAAMPPVEPPDLPRRDQGFHVASLREPSLINAPREVIRPAVPLVEDEPPVIEVLVPEVELPPPITTMEELEALMAKNAAMLEALDAAEDAPEQKKEAADEKPEAVNDDEALREYFGVALAEPLIEQGRARECMQDLAILGRMRRQVPGSMWKSGADSELRLLRKVDAIVACGMHVMPMLVQMLAERPVPDPELTWANIFLFGSISGDDTFHQCMRVAQLADLSDEEIRIAVADALALAPHPKIVGAMRPWLEDSNAPRRHVAVEALGRRRALDERDFERAFSDIDTNVVLAGANALGLAFVDVHPGLLQRLLHHDDERVVTAILRSLVTRRSRLAPDRAQELTADGKGAFGEAALIVAITHDERAHELFTRSMATGTSPIVLRALGWYGSTRFVDYLLDRLEDGDEDVKAAALEALERITGASLTKEDPDPSYESNERPFERPFTEHSIPLDLLPDPEPWRAWWNKHGRRARPDIRYRFGHAWTPRDNVWELENIESIPSTRTLAHLELAARTGGDVKYDFDDFVVRQERAIEDWRAHLRERSQRIDATGWPVRLKS